MAWFQPLLDELNEEKVQEAKELLANNGFVVLSKEDIASLEIQNMISKTQLAYTKIDVRTYEKEYIAKALGYELFRREMVEETEEDLSDLDAVRTTVKILVLRPKSL
jgi:hypothetical protein